VSVAVAPLVSVVVPVLDEAAALPALLDHLAGLAGRFEVIVADGGSQDGTTAIAEAGGVRLVHAPRGRAAQQNAGARAATGDVVVFLHADTRLPADAHARLHDALEDPAVVGGNFALRFDGDDRFSRVLGAWYAVQRRLGRLVRRLGDLGAPRRCCGRWAASRRWRSWRTTPSCVRCRRRAELAACPDRP
jgi:glycosyltransferase involved in cell wall biosynthesis